jgi:hypothetical protein
VSDLQETGPVVHFTETLVSCVDRATRIAFKTTTDQWVGGTPVAVDNGVVVVDDEHTHRRFHFRIQDIEVIREYLRDGQPGAPPARTDESSSHV